MSRPGRKPVNEHLYDASTFDSRTSVVDTGFSQSDSGRHVHAQVVHVQPIKVLSPLNLPDVYATWKPNPTLPPANTSDLEEGHATPPGVATQASGEGDTAGQKRKRYNCSDNPNAIWQENAIELLHELFRFNGLGDSVAMPCCMSCGTMYPSADSKGPPTRIFRCNDCHPRLECLPCLLDRHQSTPLHRIQEWNGEFFDTVTLAELGLVYQLGHGGLPCLSPDPALRKMVVMECNGIHQVSFRYCDCTLTHKPSNVQQLMRVGWYPATMTDPQTCATFRVLDQYRELNVRANVNVNDFVMVLLHYTNAIDPSKVPDRYKVFGRMAQQWAFLHRLKRSGVGLDIRCLDDIQSGALAVLCWACPQFGVNLPADWELKPENSFLYMPILALDANFRLKNRLRPNGRPDPELAPGSAYFVDPEPYKTFLKDYVSEKDISTCIVFAALLEKDTKMTAGLKTSGVGGCACARHELVRPQGLGDLQKGERYANMDFIFFSAIKNFRLLHLGISYDIICQWRQKLWERMARLPKELQLDPQAVTLTFGLLTWHAVAHDIKCRTANALTYQDGVGRTDGEGIERIWSLLNPSSYATKEMGDGSRHDSIDDRVDYHNFEKNLGLGVLLARRLIVAIEERDCQVASFKVHNKKLNPEIRATWLKCIADWKADRTLPNPYLLTLSGDGPTEDEVRKELEKEEKEEREQGLKIRCDARSKDLTTAQKAKLSTRRSAFMDKLKVFREHQHIYTPGAFRAMKVAEDAQDPDTPAPEAEDIKLWLPSDFSSDERVTSCIPDLAYLEVRLREGRCNDALLSLRHYLHAKKHLLGFRNANVTGQYESTRARTVINNTGDRVEMEAEKYTRCRQALLTLYDVAVLDDYPELKQDDITLEQVTDEDLLALLKLGKLKTRSHRRPHVPTGTQTLSWIWTALGGPTEQEGGLNEAIRVEWSKAMARRDRWTEEVKRLEEEMKCVRRSLDARVAWWVSKAPSVDPKALRHPATAITASMRAYATRQVALLCQVASSFEVQWNG